MALTKKEISKLALVTGLVAVAMSVAGCHTTTTRVDPYSHAWYDVYGNYCHTGYPMAGCNFYSDGYQIIDTEDPYFNSRYRLEYGWWEYYDAYGYPQDYVGWGWLSPTGVLYDDYGMALNEDENSGGRDIIADVAAQERQNIEGAGKLFAERHGLAEEAGVRIAQTLNEWATLAKSRARTAADFEDFSKRLTGVDLSQIGSALEKAQAGDKTEFNNTVAEMSRHWGTSPETSKEVLKSMFGEELKEFNIE